MGRIHEYIKRTLNDIKVTFSRFALVPVFLVAISILISLLIENRYTEDTRRILERLIFSAIAGAFFGTALEFSCERFNRLRTYKIYLQIFTLAFSVMYYFLMTSDSETDFMSTIRLVVICFALFAYYIWIPSYKNATAFSNNALAHFKACFISMLYSLVLALGFIAIFFAIDLLLVKLDDDIPAHIANIMGTFFFPLYYLSLLPDFNSSEERMLEKCKISSLYPKFLEILVSYIALPLITVFTGVLTIYLIKIAVTLQWPVGQLGPMILWYSAVGLFLYVMCVKLGNRFTLLYLKFFPMALIPLVILQLYSVFIRVNAYGITESRYYLILFGIYSIVCAAALILTKGLKPGIITILAAIFALISIVPPIDAFTVSRASQLHRVETILTQNDMFTSGKIMPNANIPGKDKVEITNILNYMFRMKHTSKVNWLPANYNQYQDFQKVFGFGEAYGTVDAEGTGIVYYSGMIEQKLPMDISGYTAGLKVSFYKYSDNTANETAFELGGKTYQLSITYLADDDVEFSVEDTFNNKEVSLTLKAHLEKLVAEERINKGTPLSPSDLTIDARSSNLKMRVILQNISFQKNLNEAVGEISAEALVLFSQK